MLTLLPASSTSPTQRQRNQSNLGLLWLPIDEELAWRVWGVDCCEVLSRMNVHPVVSLLSDEMETRLSGWASSACHQAYIIYIYIYPLSSSIHIIIWYNYRFINRLAVMFSPVSLKDLPGVICATQLDASIHHGSLIACSCSDQNGYHAIKKKTVEFDDSGKDCTHGKEALLNLKGVGGKGKYIYIYVIVKHRMGFVVKSICLRTSTGFVSRLVALHTCGLMEWCF